MKNNNIEAMQASFTRACRAAGIADTPQRRVVYRTLAESVDHPTAETLHTRVKQYLPRLSLATVYRNLKLFSKAGIIEEVATGSSYARYDANRETHHHLICRACGGVDDYYCEELARLGSRAADIDGFEVHDFKVNLFGVCRSCRAACEADSNR